MVTLLWHILLVSCGLLAQVTGAPAQKADEPRTLTHTDFDSFVRQKLTIIKFFSPYCGHCVEFAPVWNQVWQDVGKSAAKNGVHMASVDCVADGDLCARENVGFYPKIGIYREGAYVEEVQERETKDLNEYILKAAQNPAQVGKSHKSKGKLKVTASLSAVVTPALSQSKLNPTTVGSHTNVDLTPETYRSTILQGKESWLVKFYSPKCVHCTRMAAAWQEMAETVSGIHVGQVDCEAHVRLCKEADVSRFPIIKHIAGGFSREYKGLRGYGDLMDWAKNVIQIRKVPEVDMPRLRRELSSQATSGSMVHFVYVYDDATVEEDFDALVKLALELSGDHLRLFKSNDPAVRALLKGPFPTILAIPSGYVGSTGLGDLTKTDNEEPAESEGAQAKTSFKLHHRFKYEESTPKGMRDYMAIAQWTRTMAQYSVIQLTPANVHSLDAPYTVLAVVDPREKASHRMALKEMLASSLKFLEDGLKAQSKEVERRRARKQLKIDEAIDKGDSKAENAAKNTKIVALAPPAAAFAWIDGVFWERYLVTTFGTVDRSRREPRVIIVDKNRNVYYDVNRDGNPIGASRSQILDALDAITSLGGSSSSSQGGPLTAKSLSHAAHVALFSTTYFSVWLQVLLLCGIVIAAVYYKGKAGVKRAD